MGCRRRNSDWSELIKDLLADIFSRLHTRDDLLHFRSVCSHWRSSSHPIPKNLPILSQFFPHRIPDTPQPLSNYCRPPTIVATTTFLVQNPNPNFPKPWFLTVQEVNHGELILRMPLKRDAIKGDFPRVLDLSRFRVRKIREGYSFQVLEERYYPYDYKRLLFTDHVGCDPTSLDDCYAIVLDKNKKLLFVELKNGRRYGYLRSCGITCFDDIVCYKGAIWTIDRRGRVYFTRYLDNRFRLVRFAEGGVCTGYVGEMQKHLVESDEGLYLIYRHKPETEYRFSVYKLNEEEHKWCDVKDLDGRILLVSSDCCFFAPVEDFPGRVGNCILFPKPDFTYISSREYTADFNLFRESRETHKALEIGVYHLDDGKSGLITAYPGFSEIFWPPPCWLFSDTCPSTKDGNENEDEKPTLDSPCASNGVQLGKQVSNTKLPAMDALPVHMDSHASTSQNLNPGASSSGGPTEEQGSSDEPPVRLKKRKVS